jgi:hypothetical protein
MLFRAGMVVIILSDIWLQRFAIPLGGAQFVPVVMFTTYLGLGLTLASGQVIGNSTRLELFAIAVTCTIISAFATTQSFSPFSFYYIILIYLPLVFLCPLDDEEYRRCVEIFQWGMIPVSLIAIYQYVTNDPWDPILAYFPNYALPGFNTHPVIQYGSIVLRSNGILMLEPSFLSQYCAVAILLELLYYRKWWRVALFGLALLSSASGTGTLLLTVVTLAYAWSYKKLPHIAIILGVIALVAYLFPELPIVGNFINRSTEYQAPGTSGYDRFVGPFYQTFAQLGDSWQNWFFGIGPGNSKDENFVHFADSSHVGTILWAPLKLLVEYGLVGALPFCVFVCHCFFYATRSYILSAVLLILYTCLAGNLLAPFIVFVCFALLSFLPQERREIIPLGNLSEGLRDG